MPHGSFSYVLAAAVLVAGLAGPPARVARADSRPTSSDISLLSGRTLGIDQTLIAAGAGWPGVWAEATHALSSSFNVGGRATLLYGSPLMGLGSGLGGEVSVPARIHVYGHDKLDVAVALRPFVVFGQGALVGEEGAFDNDFGYALGSEAFALAGIRFSDAITFALGLGLSAAWIDVTDRAESSTFVGTGLATAAIEAALARDTLLFAQLTGGYGLAPESSFDGHAVARVSVGLTYLL